MKGSTHSSSSNRFIGECPIAQWGGASRMMTLAHRFRDHHPTFEQKWSKTCTDNIAVHNIYATYLANLPLPHFFTISSNHLLMSLPTTTNQLGTGLFNMVPKEQESHDPCRWSGHKSQHSLMHHQTSYSKERVWICVHNVSCYRDAHKWWSWVGQI